jgi:hypothetical protein
MAVIPSGSGEVVRLIYPTGGGEDRRWRGVYRDPEVALRLPPANGLDPSGIGGGGEDDLTDRRWRCAYRHPEVALTGGGASLTSG